MVTSGCLGRALAPAVDAAARVERLVPTLPAHEVGWHRHVEPHFVLVERGRYASAAEGATTDGTPLLVFNPAGTAHRDAFAPGESLATSRFVSLTVGFDLWLRLEPGADLPRHPVALAGGAAIEARAMLGALLETAAPDPLDIESTVAATAALVSHRQPQANQPPWLARCRDALRDDNEFALKPGGLTRLAKELGVHPVHLARAFRRHHRVTPGAWARAIRLERAAAALARNRDELSDIALEAGFFDQSHFTRAFRGAFGLTPAAFRRKSAPKSRA
ncbi:MAG TPA: helix-turn-helix domain-containing protein [Usitatibacteraceae bacterium]|nr:helix-turn-helix domain-containing protein [Usitatibacteraceae bacterium]